MAAPDSPAHLAEGEPAEVDNPDNTVGDQSLEVHQETSEPIEFSSPTLDIKEEPDYFRELEAEPVDETVEPATASEPAAASSLLVDPNIPGEEELQPPPTSPALVVEGAATGAPATTEPVQVGHSPSAPSRPP